jgi:fructose-bisphosphate aldolase class II
MLPTPDQYVAMLEGAAAGRYAFPAINVTSSQTLNAAMRGFAEACSDGIVQVTAGGARYFSGAVQDGLSGARAFAALGRELAGSTSSSSPADIIRRVAAKARRLGALDRPRRARITAAFVPKAIVTGGGVTGGNDFGGGPAARLRAATATAAR